MGFKESHRILDKTLGAPSRSGVGLQPSEEDGTMPLGRLLIDQNVIDPQQLEEARQHLKRAGGSLIDSLLALDLASNEELDELLDEAPQAPETIEETGLDEQFLLQFILKAALMTGLETSPRLGEYTHLPAPVVETILEIAKEKRLAEVLGMTSGHPSVYRYSLTSAGRERAVEALEQCTYTGPAPVPMARFQEQIVKQSIARDHIDYQAVSKALSHLVLDDGMVERIGPALNAGKAILFYGAVGNGKTSIAEALGAAFSRSIYLPHCFEVDGQIIKVFDSAIHVPAEPETSTAAANDGVRSTREPEVDARWVRCKRPVVVTGGELTIEMLDLAFDPVSKYYEAPAHMKATGGIFIVDDFGRQRVRSIDLLNRWIFPLERGVDFLTLHTCKKLQVAFDQMVIFSTNTPPRELMDDAGLRRIPYKFHIDSPTPEHLSQIFQQLCDAHHLEMPGDVLPYLIDHFYPKTNTAISGAHPKFIIEHVLERCRFERSAPRLDLERVRDALKNVVVEETTPPPRPATRRRRATSTTRKAGDPEGSKS